MNIKKILFIFMVCLVSTPSNAFVFKGVLGQRLNTPNGDKYSPNSGYQIGARYHILMHPNVSIRVGFSYSEVFFGWKVLGKEVAGGASYFDIPIFAAYWLTSKTNIYVGASAGIFLGKKCPTEEILCDMRYASLNRFALMTGIEFPLSENIGGEIYIEYNVGPLTNEIKSLYVLGGNFIIRF